MLADAEHDAATETTNTCNTAERQSGCGSVIMPTVAHIQLSGEKCRHQVRIRTGEAASLSSWVG
jgi:hypothetical protein